MYRLRKLHGEVGIIRPAQGSSREGCIRPYVVYGSGPSPKFIDGRKGKSVIRQCR